MNNINHINAPHLNKLTTAQRTTRPPDGNTQELSTTDMKIHSLYQRLSTQISDPNKMLSSLQEKVEFLDKKCENLYQNINNNLVCLRSAHTYDDVSLNTYKGLQDKTKTQQTELRACTEEAETHSALLDQLKATQSEKEDWVVV